MIHPGGDRFVLPASWIDELIWLRIAVYAMLSHVCNWYVKHLWSQVQVYWSESPKAKFVKQGEVDQVNIILFYLAMIRQTLFWSISPWLWSEQLQDCFPDIITFRFPSLQSWQSATRRWNGLSKIRWEQNFQIIITTHHHIIDFSLL